MPGFPLTAWAATHPCGDDVDVLLDGLRTPSAVLHPGRPTTAVVDSLLERIAAPARAACERWGASRVALVLGGPASAEPLRRIRTRTGISGPSYQVDGDEAGPAKALSSARRLLGTSLVDAVLAGGIDERAGSLLLVEKHGDAFVQLVTSAESTARADTSTLDEAAMERVLERAWDAIDRRPLGYAHLHAAPGSALASIEHRAARARLGSTPVGSTPEALCLPGARPGMLGVLLTVASLVRGYTPELTPRELVHDRALVHAFSAHGHHVALLLEARP